MRIETRYYADDEEMFYTEEECLEYEREMRDRLSSVILFNGNMKMMVNPPLYEIEESAFYIYILDAEKAKDLFEWLDDQISFIWNNDDPIARHFYYYEEDGWIDMNKQFEDLQVKFKKLEDELCIRKTMVV